MEYAKKTFRYLAGAGAVIHALAVLYYVFAGDLDLRPHGVKIYVSGLQKPLAWMVCLTALFLALTPYSSVRSFFEKATLAGRISPLLRRALAWALALFMAAQAAAVAIYLAAGKVILPAFLGAVKINGAEKPATLALLAGLGALAFLSPEERSRLAARASGWRMHAMAVLLTLALAFASGEALIRLAAYRSPAVRYLVTAGEKNSGQTFMNLEAYLASKPDIKPYMPLLNYYDNSLGMRDTEFEIPKPKGRYRILALGDSFTYGMVPYPDSVTTLVEKRLNASCGGREVEVLNFGVTGGGLWDYKTIYELAEGRYEPDMVALHFYMGNDGPSLFYGGSPTAENADRRTAAGSYLLRFIKNAVTVARSVESRRLLSEWEGYPGKGQTEARKAASPITPGLSVTDDSPELASPYFLPVRWIFYVAMAEISSMYAADDAAARPQWRPTFEILDEIARAAGRNGHKFVIILYPSSFQIYPERIAEFLEGIKEADKYREDLRNPEDAELFKSLRAEFIRPDHPNRMMAEYCQSRGLPCLDLTAPMLAAAQASPKPLYRARETHWLIRGNHAAAEAEADYLKGLVCP